MTRESSLGERNAGTPVRSAIGVLAPGPELAGAMDDLPLAEATEWYERTSRGRWRPEFSWRPTSRPPRSWSWYLGGLRGKGPAPANSQSLVADLVTAIESNDASPDGSRGGTEGWLIVVPAAFAPHSWTLPRPLGWEGAAGAGHGKALRYAVIPLGSPLGTVVHEVAHLMFDWPDLAWPHEFEADCLMARGALRGSGRDPAPPCAALRGRIGWNEVVPITPASTFDELTDDRVGRFETEVEEVWVERREDRTGARWLACICAKSERVLRPRPLARSRPREGGPGGKVLGWLAPFLRRAGR